jgi:hypothetical protein
MTFDTPAPLRAEHEALHARLVEATRAPGAVGVAAREVARLLHSHFVREEAFALPPLALLAELARGGATAEMAQVLPMTRRLEVELPAMLDEHAQIVAALQALRAAALEAGQPAHAAFADALVEHAQTEEEVLYPAAILVGRQVAQALKA